MSGTSSRGNPRLSDIVRSMAVLGLLVLVVWGLTRIYSVTPDQPTPAVNYEQTVESARPAADFELLAPRSLPEGWRATVARFTPRTWHLGVVTDEEEYLGLQQLPLGEVAAVQRFAEGSREVGPVDVDGTRWTRWDAPDGDITLVRREDGTTTLVTGTGGADEVTRYVASLSAS